MQANSPDTQNSLHPCSSTSSSPISPVDIRKSLDIVEVEVYKTHTSSSNLDHAEKGTILQPSQAPAHPLISFWRRSPERARYHEIATQPSVFDDPATVSYFAPPPTYENTHRFDPSFRWTWGEERSVVSKLDWRITVWSLFVFIVYDMNRSNLIQANTDNFLPDLGLNTNDYNMGNTVLRVTALCSEIPAQLIARKVGIDRYMPVQMTLWGLVSISQFWLTGRTTFLITRFFIALFSSGVIANAIVYMSYFFTNIELPFRATIFVSGNRVNDIVSPILALGILRLRGKAGKEGWRWLFLIEGTFTLIMAIWSVYILTPSITQTKARHRPGGWFSEREEKILVNRLLRDDPAKSTMHNRQAMTLKLYWQALCEYDTWPLYLISLIARIPAFVPDVYFTLILRGLRFTTTQSNLLTIPPYIAYLFTAFGLTLLAEKTNQRCLTTLLGQFWHLPILISLLLVTVSFSNRWVVYAHYASFLAGPSFTGYMAGWVSRNSNSVATRSTGSTIFAMTIQASLLVSSNIYREDDRPAYRRGNRVLLGLNVASIFLIIATKAYYVWRNKQRTRKWDALTEDQKAQYLEDHKEETGPSRLDFTLTS